MNYLFYQLRRLFMFPFRLVTSPGKALGSAWSESSRNKSLFLGLPALIIAGLAVAAIGGVQLLSQESLEDRYDYLYQKTTAELVSKSKELARAQNVRSISGAPANVVTEEDKLELLQLRQTQKIYLDKLIALDPENSDYRFELASLVSSRNDKAHAFSILNELAPEDVPGYPRAHAVLAKYYFEKPTRTEMENAGNRDIALKHVNHVLTRDESNSEAKLLKAKILEKQKRYPAAYDLYNELFEINPTLYTEMSDLNKKMGSSDRDRMLFEKAYQSFKLLSGKEENQVDDKRWIVIEQGIAKTLQELRRFPEIEDRLVKQIQKYAADPQGGGRRRFLQQLLAETYIVWANDLASANLSYDRLDSKLQAQLLDLYTKAYSNFQENVLVLQALARLSLSSDPQISEQARAIYDPNADVDAPAPVLNQLGNNALVKKRFSEAIRFYERAREKSPKDSAVLNNLSYTYLVAQDDDRNAERALQLINEAIRYLPQDVDPAERSKFLHTKATALKQQDRLQEALAVFEQSLKSRPMHPDTLRSLIECYRGLNKIPPEQYGSRLEQVEQEMRLESQSSP